MARDTLLTLGDRLSPSNGAFQVARPVERGRLDLCQNGTRALRRRPETRNRSKVPERSGPLIANGFHQASDGFQITVREL